MENENANVIGVEALFEKALRLYQSHRSRQDFNKAIQMFRICSQAEHLEAQFHLGMALKFVNEDGKELKEAVLWLKRAANRGRDLAFIRTVPRHCLERESASVQGNAPAVRR